MNKIFRTILVIIAVLAVIGMGFMIVRFTPPIFKLLGVAGNVVTIWFFIKYIKAEYFSKKKIKKDDGYEK